MIARHKHLPRDNARSLRVAGELDLPSGGDIIPPQDEAISVLFIRREDIPLFFFGFFGGMVVAKAGEVWNIKALLIIGGLSIISTLCICLFRSLGGLKGSAQAVAFSIVVLAIILVGYWLWPWGQGNHPIGPEQATPR